MCTDHKKSKNSEGDSDSFCDIGAARIDLVRERRCGMPEVVYGEGKTISQIMAVSRTMVDKIGKVLVTRIGGDAGEQLLSAFPEGLYDPAARIFVMKKPQECQIGDVLVVTAGTSDLGIALEAKYTLEFCGVGAEILTDVGVAGIERLFAAHDRLRRADVCIVIAGMDGALPSVVGGLVKSPVIAVPASVGYGANFQGLAPLLSMLNSCAAGVTVVNIDNGFGAACAAIRMIKTLKV